jgi:putative endonuclease
MKKFTSNSQKIGQIGENIASKYLIRHGFSIIERNYTRKWGEIDIIAKKGNKIHFVEVKSKTVEPTYFSNIKNPKYEARGIKPEENVHYWKIKKLRRVIETYLTSQRIGNILWQFDIAIVYLNIDKKLAQVKMMENIIL